VGVIAARERDFSCDQLCGCFRCDLLAIVQHLQFFGLGQSLEFAFLEEVCGIPGSAG